MAINRTPDPVLCANRWRHRDLNQPATAFVRGQPTAQGHDGDGLVGWTARCDPCVRELAARSADAVLVDVIDLGPFRTAARYDPDTAADRS